jgi:hypothetical protein
MSLFYTIVGPIKRTKSSIINVEAARNRACKKSEKVKRIGLKSAKMEMMSNHERRKANMLYNHFTENYSDCRG